MRSKPPAPALLRGLANCVLALAAFLGAAFAIHAVLPFPEVPVVAEKLRRFAAEKDGFTTMFVGSSHIYQQLSPRLFDETLARRGIAGRSFNLGVNGMSAPESFFTLRRVMAMRPAKLRQVFFEATNIAREVREDNAASLRNVYWCDLPHTLILLKQIAGTRNATAGKKLGWALEHLRHGARNMLNLGRGNDLLATLFASDAKPPRRPGDSDAEEDGYRPSELRITGAKAVERYHAAVERTASVELPAAKSGGVLAEEVAKLEAELRAQGVAIIFIVAPVAGIPNFRRLGAQHPGAVVWDFCDPSAWPALFQIENRQDAHHLNRAGAEEFTRLLATRFADNVHTLK